jgi:hypothetical protein
MSASSESLAQKQSVRKACKRPFRRAKAGEKEPPKTSLAIVRTFADSPFSNEGGHYAVFHMLDRSQGGCAHCFNRAGVNVVFDAGARRMRLEREPMRQGLGVLPLPSGARADHRRRVLGPPAGLPETGKLSGSREKQLRRVLDGMERPWRSGEQPLSGRMRPIRQSRSRLADGERILCDAISGKMGLRGNAALERKNRL